MIDPNFTEYQIGKKIGHALMTYVVIRLVIKGTKMIFKHGRILFASSPSPIL